MGVCEEILLWLILEEPQLQVPLMYSWRCLVSRPYKISKVRWGVMEQGDTWDESGSRGRGTSKGQGSPLVLHGNDSDSDIVSQGIATAVPTDGHDHSGSHDLYHEWRSGQKKLHVCALIRPPYTYAQCNCKRYLWCEMRFLFDHHRLSREGWGHSRHRSVDSSSCPSGAYYAPPLWPMIMAAT